MWRDGCSDDTLDNDVKKPHNAMEGTMFAQFEEREQFTHEWGQNLAVSRRLPSRHDSLEFLCCSI